MFATWLQSHDILIQFVRHVDNMTIADRVVVSCCFAIFYLFVFFFAITLNVNMANIWNIYYDLAPLFTRCVRGVPLQSSYNWDQSAGVPYLATRDVSTVFCFA